MYHLEHDNVRLCSVPSLPGTPLSLHWVSGLVGSPCHTVQDLIQEFLVIYGMMTPGFTIMQSDMKRLALSVVAFDLEGWICKHHRRLCSRLKVLLPASTWDWQKVQSVGREQQELTHWGLLK